MKVRSVSQDSSIFGQIKKAFGGNATATISLAFFTVVSFLGKLLILSFPFFTLADYRLADQTISGNRYGFSKSFEGDKSTGAQWTLVMMLFLKISIYLTVAAVMVGVYFLLWFIAQITINLNLYALGYAIPIYLIIFYIIVGITVILMHLYLTPTTFLIYENPDKNISEIFALNHQLHTLKVKSKLVLQWLYYMLRFISLSAIGYAFYRLALNYLITSLVILTGVIIGIVLGLVLPRILLANRMATIQLFRNAFTAQEYVSLLDSASGLKSSSPSKKGDALKHLFDELVVNDVSETDELKVE